MMHILLMIHLKSNHFLRKHHYMKQFSVWLFNIIPLLMLLKNIESQRYGQGI